MHFDHIHPSSPVLHTSLLIFLSHLTSCSFSIEKIWVQFALGDYSWVWMSALECGQYSTCQPIEGNWLSLSHQWSNVCISLDKGRTLCPPPILHAGVLSVLNLYTFCVCWHSLCQFISPSSIVVSGNHFFLSVITTSGFSNLSPHS